MGPGADLLKELMSQAATIARCSPHQPGAHRRRQNHQRARSGSGVKVKAPNLPKFAELRQLNGAIISAVDLVRGVGLLAGWTRIDVPGATGYLDTDYVGQRLDMPWRPSRSTTSSVSTSRHRTRLAMKGRADAKVEALQRIDTDIVGPTTQRASSLPAMADPDRTGPFDVAADPRP